ncbi:MAG TPA: hypothetical protein VJ984_03140 [Xanthomonadales bacterium]|nr:hypothetical protein [Xanthomonadales bacterium]
MKIRNTHALLLLLIWSQSGVAQNLGDPDCETLWLVSSYSTNAIKVFDGCSGDFIQNIEDNGWLRGPQAIVDDGQGGLLVVSEENGRLIRIDQATLTIDRVIAGDDPETTEVEIAPLDKPTGLAVSNDGRAFLGSFTQNQVIEIDPVNGDIVGTVISASQGIEGVDAGMWIQGNQLYVPGFDSSTIVAVNIAQNSAPQTLVSEGSNGLNAPRTILVDDQGDLLVSSWRGNQILAFERSSGNFKRVVASVSRPTGMVLESPGVLLVTSDQVNDVKRIRISDGAVIATPVPAGGGGIRGGTWITVIEKVDVPTESAAIDNHGFFLIGVGNIVERSISVDSMIYTTGGQWGVDLNPAEIGEQVWGTVLIEFTGCNQATITFVSDEPVFGSGEYEIVRLASSPLGDACEAIGFANVEDFLWMSGHWFGGADRSGEGFSIDVINGNQVIVTWYSYLPQALTMTQ